MATMNVSTGPFRLYGQNISYFTAKVRCALLAKGIWFDEIKGDFDEIRRRIGPDIFIPIVVTPEDETWQDSSDIIDRLEARFPEPALLPTSPRHRIVSLLVELYVDEFGLLPAMTWRWGTEARRKSSARYFEAIFGPMGRMAAESMISRTAEIGVISATVPAVEAHTHDLLLALNRHFETHPYMLGEKISYADCALMGLMYGHLFNDYESRGVLLETAPFVVGWVERCNAPGTDRDKQWLGDDTIPATLIDVLRTMGTDSLPLILACARVANDWAAGAPDGIDMPRSAGKATAMLRGVPVEREALTYSLYMIQRVTDAWSGLSDSDQALLHPLLEQTGWQALKEAVPARRVRKSGVVDLELEPRV